ncbi:MAG TPA: WecB/TagA/CpsF family glycosyltransferase, partial [Patescibacteria group bacterium]|nr:WecB/TagA/CpsF family glycosyltransferase [Patescibacteria group bacterium]
NYSVYLLGGFGDTPKIVADALISKYPNITISGYSNKNPSDESIISDIKKAAPDFLFVAFGPIRQEQWIAAHLAGLPSAKLAIGLGGTFDYIAGKRKTPPPRMRAAGLEWLYRLATQPRRAGRIWNATIGLVTALVRYKVFSSLPYRQNAACAIINPAREILIIRRNPDFPNLKDTGNTDPKKFADYWELPKGGIDGSETAEEAARREAWEELGIADKDLQFIKISPRRRAYAWNQATRPLLGNVYHYKGQEQSVAYFNFTGDPKKITVDRFENAEFKWVAIARLPEAVNPEIRPLADIVISDIMTGI